MNAAQLPQQFRQTVTSPHNRTAAGVSDGRRRADVLFCSLQSAFLDLFQSFTNTTIAPECGDPAKMKWMFKEDHSLGNGIRGVTKREILVMSRTPISVYSPSIHRFSPRHRKKNKTNPNLHVCFSSMKMIEGKSHDVAEIATLASMDPVSPGTVDVCHLLLEIRLHSRLHPSTDNLGWFFFFSRVRGVKVVSVREIRRHLVLCCNTVRISQAGINFQVDEEKEE